MPADALAAIDLGSNSFHLLIARADDTGHLQTIDRMRDMVQLAAGLDEQRRISRGAEKRALDCLARFGQRLRHMPDTRVRAVGTNTLRQARNSTEFLQKAEEALGHPVEIISGIEEARLIYLGVVRTTANGAERQLVIDIGGGSTELIIGEQFEPVHLESLFMGCVSMTKRAFADGHIREVELRAAELAVQMELEPIALRYKDLGWKIATGASGTIKAIRDVILSEGWSGKDITLEGLRRLQGALLEARNTAGVAQRWGLEPARAEVFCGGFSVLHGICETLGIESLQVADGALREGVVYDFIGRISHQDARERTIATLTERFRIDRFQAKRVAATALRGLEQAREDWDLTDERYVYDLAWAAHLHEIGLAMAHSQYHKHGAYIIRYSDLPGFSQSEQDFIAALIRGHRRKFPLDAIASLPKNQITVAQRLCVLLRLAVVLHRSRSSEPLPEAEFRVKGKRIKLKFPSGWLQDHPLTQADMEAEAQYLKAADFKLSVE